MLRHHPHSPSRGYVNGSRGRGSDRSGVFISAAPSLSISSVTTSIARGYGKHGRGIRGHHPRGRGVTSKNHHPARNAMVGLRLPPVVQTRLGRLNIMPSSSEAQTEPELSELEEVMQSDERTVQSMMEKQFSMLRYDCTLSIRSAICGCIRDLSDQGYGISSLEQVLLDGGGIHKPAYSADDASPVPLISDVKFTKFVLHRHAGLNGLAFYVSASAPPGPARSPMPRTRVMFWEQGKRLMSGGMVALITVIPGAPPDVRMATVAKDVTLGVPEQRNGIPSIDFALNFPDPKDAEWASSQFLQGDQSRPPTRFILENPILHASYTPFLRALQTADPIHQQSSLYSAINFDSSTGTPPNAPAYARNPSFRWDLTPLLNPGCTSTMQPSSEGSIAGARQMLKSNSTLDPSQANAIVSALTQELCLLQGPPGTGKTYTGVQLLRLLVHNNVGPIIVMAQTNHALDNILSSTYNSGTTNMIRLGAGSADPILSQLSLKNKAKKAQGLGPIVGSMIQMETEMLALSDKMSSVKIPITHILELLTSDYSSHWFSMNEPPAYIEDMMDREGGNDDGWGTDRRGRLVRDAATWRFWVNGEDIRRLGKFAKKDTAQYPGMDKVTDWMANLNLGRWGDGPEAGRDQSRLNENNNARSEALDNNHRLDANFGSSDFPSVSTTDRSIDTLLVDPDVWNYSRTERKTFGQHLETETRSQGILHYSQRFRVLAAQYEASCTMFHAAQKQSQGTALEGVKIIGCTTNGAARLRDVIQMASPTVLIIEEAGQALEAHVLAALSPSIQHVIHIGDPQQLRCITNCHQLSVDSSIGAAHYRLNESMMERLSAAGYPMAQLQTQRRMRPQISALIRNTIYPELLDGDRVLGYPQVQGASKNVYFFDHQHMETADGQGGTKANPWEAKMAAELALYFAKQGYYPAEKGVVILCAYAGQVAEMGYCLQGRANVITGDKEKEAMARSGKGGFFNGSSDFDLTVMVRTIDSFQGEEAEIIILSLVRNGGDDPGRTIGFLRTNNRINVAVSRAKQGLYILGNAPQLAAQSVFWHDAIDQLRTEGCVGDSMPLGCSLHGASRPIRDIYDFEQLEVKRKCKSPCAIELPCGHHCAKTCHLAKPEHVATDCTKRCTRRREGCGHQCSKTCGEDCGVCEAVVGQRVLPCGHEIPVQCHQRGSTGSIKCPTMIPINGQTCEHTIYVPCGSSNLEPQICQELCGRKCHGCGQTCTAKCITCQHLSQSPSADPKSVLLYGIVTPPPEHTDRIVHAEHPCSRPRENCGHICRTTCNPNHHHSRPMDDLLQATYGEGCDVEGAAEWCTEVDVVDGMLCNEPCERSCSHQICERPCHGACSVPVCDEICDEELQCGHRCPSICSEPCDQQICSVCAGADFEILAIDGFALANHASGAARRCTVTHSCGSTIVIGALSSLTVNRSLRCPTCRDTLYTPTFDSAKTAARAHFEQHVILEFMRQLNDINPLSSRRVRDLNAAITTVLVDIPLPPPGPMTSHTSLDQWLSPLIQHYDTAQPISIRRFDQNLEQVFRLPPHFRKVWRALVHPLLQRHLQLEPFYSPPIETSSTSTFRLRAILQSIGCRLILALYARQFSACLLRSAQGHNTQSSSYVAHLFHLMGNSFLISCDRDIGIADYIAGRPAISPSSRIAVSTCHIILSQSTFLLTQQPSSAATMEELETMDKSLAAAEDFSRGVLGALKGEAGVMEGKARRHLAITEEIYGQWEEIWNQAEVAGESGWTKLLDRNMGNVFRLANGEE